MDKRRRCLLLPLLSLILFSGGMSRIFPLDPQTPLTRYRVRRWTTRDGLPMSRVTAIRQTPEGYLWLGTQQGLVRYNGYSFTLFDQGNLPELRNLLVSTLEVDREGRLWAGTHGGGVICWEKKRFRGVRRDTPANDRMVVDLLAERNRIWVGGESSLFWLDEKGKEHLVPVPGVDFKELGYPRALGRSMDLGIYALCSQGALVWVGERNGVIRGSVLGHLPFLPSAMAVDPSGTVWMGGDQEGLWAYRPGEKGMESVAGSRDLGPITALMVDAHARIWVGTQEKGLYRYEPGTGSWSHLELDAEHRSGAITALWEDLEGNLWVGTASFGLFRLSDVHFVMIGEEQGLPGRDVRGLYQSGDGHIWGIIAGCSGVFRWDQKSRFERMPLPDLGGDYPTDLCGDGQGGLLVGSSRKGLLHWTPHDVQVYGRGAGLPENSALAVFRDRTGRVWVGNRKGVYWFVQGRFTEVPALKGIPVHGFFQGAEWVWAGTPDGRVLAMKGDVCVRTVHLAEEQPSHSVLAVWEDADGRLWVGTYGGGLLVEQGGRMHRISRAQGLFDSVVYAIVPDGQGMIWMSSNRGVFRIPQRQALEYARGERDHVLCSCFGENEGLADSECNGGAAQGGLMTGDGRLVFATVQGLAVLDLERYHPNPFMPPVMLEELLLDGQVYRDDFPLEMHGRINQMELRYAGLSLTSPDKVLYRYRLDGLDRDWVDVGNRRSAYYTNLPPGRYRFQVMAFNGDAGWNYAGAQYRFAVVPFFWQTIWFRGLVGAFLGLLILALFRFRLKRAHQQAHQLEGEVARRTTELVELNTALARANEFKAELLNTVAHDLKNPLQGIMGYGEMIKRAPDIRPEIRERAAHILASAVQMLELINQTLNSATIDSGRLQLKQTCVNLSHVVRQVAEAYQPLGIQKNQDIAVVIPEDFMVLGDKYRLREIVENLVSNAVKYSPYYGTIRMELERNGREVHLTVADEGPGLDTRDLSRIFRKFERLGPRPTGGESSTGLGLFIAKRLVELHKGRIWVETRVGQGSRFHVALALCEEHAHNKGESEDGGGDEPARKQEPSGNTPEESISG